MRLSVNLYFLLSFIVIVFKLLTVQINGFITMPSTQFTHYIYTVYKMIKVDLCRSNFSESSLRIHFIVSLNVFLLLSNCMSTKAKNITKYYNQKSYSLEMRAFLKGKEIHIIRSLSLNTFSCFLVILSKTFRLFWNLSASFNNIFSGLALHLHV